MMPHGYMLRDFYRAIQISHILTYKLASNQYLEYSKANRNVDPWPKLEDDFFSFTTH